MAEWLPSEAMAVSGDRLTQLFGSSDLVPLWVAEPYLPLAPNILEAMAGRASQEWFGYEQRPDAAQSAFWEWMVTRHGWSGDGVATSVSPSVGTSIGVLLEERTQPGDGVILQPPVFTDFKPLVVSSGRRVAKNPLILDGDRYRMDLEGLERVAADPASTALILCNPHNPVGRAWTVDELSEVARICAAHGVFVIADEVHADLTLPGSTFVPFGTVSGSGSWAALHGPIKTFGLAGVCDTLLLSSDESIVEDFRAASERLHLTRNNVFSLAAFGAAYRHGASWVDGLIERVVRNRRVLAAGLPGPLRLLPSEATYLGWLDLRGLGLDAPGIVRWLGEEARVAMSPGHWFGREGAGFARLTLAAPEEWIDEALERIRAAVR